MYFFSFSFLFYGFWPGPINQAQFLFFFLLFFCLDQAQWMSPVPLFSFFFLFFISFLLSWANDGPVSVFLFFSLSFSFPRPGPVTAQLFFSFFSLFFSFFLFLILDLSLAHGARPRACSRAWPRAAQYFVFVFSPPIMCSAQWLPRPLGLGNPGAGLHPGRVQTRLHRPGWVCAAALLSAFGREQWPSFFLFFNFNFNFYLKT